MSESPMILTIDARELSLLPGHEELFVGDLIRFRRRIYKIIRIIAYPHRCGWECCGYAGEILTIQEEE